LKSSWKIQNAGVTVCILFVGITIVLADVAVQRVRQACGEALQPLQAGVVLQQVCEMHAAMEDDVCA
jgi:hypothetical protein